MSLPKIQEGRKQTKGAATQAALNLPAEDFWYSERMNTLSAINSMGTRAPYILRDRDIIMNSSDSPYVLRVRDLEDDQKPRERLMRYGPKDLSLAELVAILLGVGTRREDVLTMARRILKEYGEHTLLNETKPAQLAELLQIPITKASQLVASF
jgi:hypothetical protein